MEHGTTSPHSRDAIARELGVTRNFDAAAELERRIAFLADYLIKSGRAGYVLGISGGVDSTVAARIAQLAVERVRGQGKTATFVAVRLPYGDQRDEDDAAQALDFISPDRRMRIDIKPAVDAQRDALRAAGLEYADEAAEDFGAGNIKARQRMIAQYAIAGALDCLVIGTDQAAEALMGFFTKHGDGAADVLPLRGLTKRRVRALGSLLGAPDRLVLKVPTADLESLRPLRPDEDAYGVTYVQIDAYLEGGEVSEDAVGVIERQFRATSHKRELPPGPPG
jgi:NAD+ synthase